MGSRRREEEEDKMTAEDGSTGASLFIHDSHNYLRHFSTQPAPMLAEYRSHRRRRKAVMGMSWSANLNTQPALILGECQSQVRVHVPVNFFCEEGRGRPPPHRRCSADPESCGRVTARGVYRHLHPSSVRGLRTRLWWRVWRRPHSTLSLASLNILSLVRLVIQGWYISRSRRSRR